MINELKGQCHQKSRAFNHMIWCFRPNQWSMNWCYDLLSKFIHFSKWRSCFSNPLYWLVVTCFHIRTRVGIFQSIRIQQYIPCHAKSSGYSNICHAMPKHPDTAIYPMPCQIMLFHFYKLGLGIRSMVFCTNRSFFKQKERIALSFALFERANRSFCTFIKSD